jgi:hypothetical protein
MPAAHAWAWPAAADGTVAGVWDGRNLAAVQIATAVVPRVHGRPCAEVDAEWNLTVAGVPVPAGAAIAITSAGVVRVESAAHPAERSPAS